MGISLLYQEDDTSWARGGGRDNKGKGLEGKELQEGVPVQEGSGRVTSAGGMTPLFVRWEGTRECGQGLMPESHVPPFPLRLHECDQILSVGSCFTASQSLLDWRKARGEREGSLHLHPNPLVI